MVFFLFSPKTFQNVVFNLFMFLSCILNTPVLFIDNKNADLTTFDFTAGISIQCKAW